jgi:hypothetical protein
MACRPVPCKEDREFFETTREVFSRIREITTVQQRSLTIGLAFNRQFNPLIDLGFSVPDR